MLWQSAYVGVGSNLDDPVLQVRRALAQLQRLPSTRLISQSSLYGSKPWGYSEQPDFVNAVAALLTQLPAGQLFQALQDLEAQLGRTPSTIRWGPRRIDLDLLVFDQQCIDTPQLKLPHPLVVTRNFVLYPLCELAPDLLIPGSARVSELVTRVDQHGIWRLHDSTTTHGA